MIFSKTIFGQYIEKYENKFFSKGLLSLDLEGVDTLGQDRNLYSIKSKYIIVYFHDLECKHCMDFIPIFSSKYDSLKKLGYEFYGVLVNRSSLESGIINLKKCYQECKIRGYNVILKNTLPITDTTKSGYYVFSTPQFNILDSEKHFRAKQLRSSEIFKGLKRIDP
ncbi:MAG: redoxin domain-containing protein [Bacteroidota bacterium]|nr:redoxin domain-containing protein [Bacteroidota bacterium]